MNQVSFYGGLVLIVIGLGLIVFGNRARGSKEESDSEIEIIGFRFRSKVPGAVVMAFGVVLMLISTRFPEQLFRTHEVRDFSQDGGIADFPCESHGTSTVIYTAPSGFKIISAQADTKDVVSTKTASARIISQDAHRVMAQADFEGKDKDFGLNCPGGGHGRVTVHGQFETE
jgi:hypothetical protein